MKCPGSGGDRGISLSPGLLRPQFLGLLDLPQGIKPKDEQQKMDQEEKRREQPTQTKENNLEDGLGLFQDLSPGLRMKLRWSVFPTRLSSQLHV